ncbi:IS66-like element accessory protein TnpA [Aquabacter spiritensis]|uniref:IS66-like element accessory protein TnpA n=1 Tax=Aquabacter spiritensis TaxID=933073 RepID=UPI00105328B2|nr:transposase [Aquabacter spiritensis]
MEDVRLDGRLQARNEGGDYRRIEVITGRRRRREWSDEEKAQILAESAAPGASVSEIARRHGVNRGLLTVWRRQAGLTKRRCRIANAVREMPMFVPLEIVADTDARTVACQDRRARIEVELRGGRIVIDGEIDPRLARAVVAAVRSRS